MLKVLSLASIAFLIAAAGLGGLVGVANASAPGDILYGIDRAAEQVNLALSVTPERAMAVQVGIAAERLGEVQTLLASGENERAEKAMVEFEQSIALITPSVTGATGSLAEQAGDSMDEAFEPVSDDEQDLDEYSLYCETGAYISGAPEHPVGVRLAAFYEVELEEIMGWFCQGNGFGEIKLAYAAAAMTEFTTEEIFVMRAEGLGWGEIWNAIGLIAHPGKDAKDGVEVPEDEEEGEAEDEDELNEGNYCTTDGIHPHGQQLADEFEVEYAEIMEWFCDGYGFGEIKLAYSISQKKEIAVTEVFALRESGLGWGEVMKQYEMNGKDLKPDKDTGKPEDKPGGKPEDKPNNKK